MPNPRDESNEPSDPALVVRRDDQGRIIQIIDRRVGHSTVTFYAFDPATPLEQLSEADERASQSGG